MDLLAGASAEPVFDAKTFDTELEGQIAGLKEEDDEIFEYGFRKLREAFFEQHPFAIGSDGLCRGLGTTDSSRCEVIMSNCSA